MLDFLNGHVRGVMDNHATCGVGTLSSRILGDDGQMFLLFLLAIATLIALSIHEFGHAWMADKLGDPGPRKDGRVTLAPWAHLDPLGTLLIVASTLIGFPVGWGKPVKTDPETYTVDRKLGVALVAGAGPLMNLLAAFVLAAPARFLLGVLQNGAYPPSWEPFLAITFLINVMVMLVSLSLFAFNLLPLYPLDGSHVLANLLPNDIAVVYVRIMKRYGTYLFLGLLVSGVLNDIVGPVVIGLFRFLLGV
ncbi:MAG: site-2 protease family protein [Akkermansiaceae bacterium]|nr:site-2 protease family protein [Armatimonadota bacterium]